jgi:hypothetical protein
MTTARADANANASGSGLRRVCAGENRPWPTRPMPSIPAGAGGVIAPRTLSFMARSDQIPNSASGHGLLLVPPPLPEEEALEEC